MMMADVLSFWVSLLGVVWAFIANFFPKQTREIALRMSYFASEPLHGLPSWSQSRKFRVAGTALPALLISKVIAEAFYFQSEGGALFYLAYLAILAFVASLLFEVFYKVLGLFLYPVYILYKCIYIVFHIFIKGCLAVSPESDPIVGFGLVVAVLGFAIGFI